MGNDPPKQAWPVFAQSVVSDRVRDELLSAIESGRLKVGDRLPSERDLASAMGVGRTTIREALQNLRANGRVEVRRGKGVFVAEPRLPRELQDILVADGHSLEEIYEMREVLDVEAARLAARRYEASDLEAMRQTLSQIDEIREQDGNAEEILRLGSQFHLQVCRAAHNTLLEKVQAAIREFLGTADYTRVVSSDRTSSVAKEHRLLLEAIADRDEDQAAALARYHLEASRSHLRQSINSKPVIT